jgi:hypothetical protein
MPIDILNGSLLMLFLVFIVLLILCSVRFVGATLLPRKLPLDTKEAERLGGAVAFLITCLVAMALIWPTVCSK